MKIVNHSDGVRHTTSRPFAPRAGTLAVLGAGLAARLLVLWIALTRFPSGWFFTRGLEMDLVARSLLAGHGLASPFGGSTGPTAIIAPVYPLLVACIYRLCGNASPLAAFVLISLQILASLVTLWLILQLARRLFHNTIALLAGLLWALSPPLLWVPTIFWETSFSIALLLTLLALALRCADRPSRPLWLVLGACAGLTALVNPALLLPALALIAWAAAFTGPATRSRASLAFLAFLVVFSIWPLRNARAFHAFVPLRTTVGIELWMGNHDGSDGYLNESLLPIYNPAEMARFQQLGEVPYNREKTALARTWIEAHPAAFLTLTVHRIVRFWTGSGSRGGSALFVLHATFTALFGLAGLGLLFYRRDYRLAALFGLPLLLFPLPYYLSHAEFRYRLVLDPLCTLLAFYFLVSLFQRHQARTATRL